MKAVTFQAPGEVRVDEREPELLAPDDAIVQVEATGVCGSDLHIYHGRVKIEPGFVIGHEFVGEVIAAGDAVTKVDVGDRVLGCFHTACGSCFFCMRGQYHKCDEARVFGHGATLGSLPGAQAEQVLVPRANLTLRRVPDGMSDDAAVRRRRDGHRLPRGRVGRCAPGRHGRRAGPRARRPVRRTGGASGAAQVIAVDSVSERLAVAREFGAHAAPDRGGSARGGEERPAAAARTSSWTRSSSGRARHRLPHGAQAGPVSAVGVYAERCEVHMGVVWIKALTIRTGHANVIAHVDSVLAMMQAGLLDPTPLVSRHMKLDEAPDAYEAYANREALKIVMAP